MFANERHSKILNILHSKGAVTTSELTDAFDVSIETVRRDLLFLEKSGKLQRVHGGAIPVGEMKPLADLPHRLEDNPQAKAQLSETAAECVNNGDIIFIDSGSTAVFFAEAIKNRFYALTVVTHSLDVFNILSVKDGFEVILCGGSFMRDEKAFYGKMVLDTLRNLHVNKAFIFPSAISLKSGICDYNQELAQVQQCAMSSGDEVFILADGNKFEKRALLKISDMNRSFTYITDSSLSGVFQMAYAENGLTVITEKKKRGRANANKK